MIRAPRSTRALLAEAEAMQSGVIATLLSTGNVDFAHRIRRCQQERASRRGGMGFGWPWRCRSPGCWSCRRSAGWRWWLGMLHWAKETGGPVSLAVVPLRHEPGGLRAAVARLRRSLRDFRDRTARSRPSWSSMAIAGMATANQTALLLIRHGDLSRREVADTLGRRWPSCMVGDLGTVSPSWTMPNADAIELARIRRGVEPLRILVLDRRSAVSMPLPAEPMPTLF